MERPAQRCARWAGADLSSLTKVSNACTREDRSADSGAPGGERSLRKAAPGPRAGRVLPPPPPQSGARAPPPRFRFPRRHLRHGHRRHRYAPRLSPPGGSGGGRAASRPRAGGSVLILRGGTFSAAVLPRYRRGSGRRFGDAVTGSAAAVPSPKMAAGAGVARREDGGGGSGALAGRQNSLGWVRGAGWDCPPQPPPPSQGLPIPARTPRFSPAVS